MWLWRPGQQWETHHRQADPGQRRGGNEGRSLSFQLEEDETAEVAGGE